MSKKQIQVALDTLDFDKTCTLAALVSPYVDIIEIGTPCIKYNGIQILKALQVACPSNQILVDLKTMDAGFYEASAFYQAGADICTVLGAAGIPTIRGVVEAASAHGKQAQVDLINVDDKAGVARAAVVAGAHIIGIHTGLDAQAAGATPFVDLHKMRDLNLDALLSVAGGIHAGTVQQVAKLGVDIIVIGAAIYGAASPATAAANIRRLLDEVVIL